MKSALSSHNFNTSLLMDQLQYHEIKAVHVEFSGSNDSGDMRIVKLEPLTADEEIPPDLLDYVRVPKAKMGEVWEFDVGGQGRTRDWTKNPATLRELIIDVCAEELEMCHGGWEINAGSSGTIVLTPLAAHYKTKQIVLSIEYGYEESPYDYEGEEYNDE